MSVEDKQSMRSLMRSIAAAAALITGLAGCGASSGEASVGTVMEGDGFTVTIPAGFVGGTTGDQMREALASAFPGEDVEPLVQSLVQGQTELFAADPASGLQSTILFTRFSPQMPLGQVAARYVGEVRRQGARVLDVSRTRIGGTAVAKVTYEDPTVGSGLQTDAYIYPYGEGGWVLEYAALTKGFDEIEDRYLESVDSFEPT